MTRNHRIRPRRTQARVAYWNGTLTHAQQLHEQQQQRHARLQNAALWAAGTIGFIVAWFWVWVPFVQALDSEVVPSHVSRTEGE